MMNNLERFKDIFADVTPWAGETPRGYSVDFLGTLTDIALRVAFAGDPASVGGKQVRTALPTLDETSPDLGWDVVSWRGER